MRGFSPFQFQELILVFDKWIWFLVINSMVAIAFTLRPLISLNQSSNWMAPVKLLLEQGDPFSGNVGTTYKFKVVIGIFMLMGIILSNAYKNSNVYNIISPKKPIPTEFFQELIQDNFSVYTRVDSTHFMRMR